MKRLILLLLSLSLLLFAFSGCRPQDITPPDGNPSEEGVKTGLAVITSIGKSMDATDKDGIAQTDSTVVAVTVDRGGKIVKCKIDAAQSVIKFSSSGKITTPLDTVFASKQELGENYGMKKVSKIGKEWNEQANALSEYVVGKTVNQVKGIAVNAESVPTDADLAANVTIKIAGYIDAIEKAVNNAKDIGAKASDSLGLGVFTKINKSKDAGEQDGIAQAYSYYAATTFDKDGKITSSMIDASQTDVKFNNQGKLTVDKNAGFKTKLELGEGYGMKKVSGIGKEWYEQAEALSKYVVGKTVAEVKGFSVDQKGAPTDAELKSSVTIAIVDYIDAIEKSFNSAK